MPEQSFWIYLTSILSAILLIVFFRRGSPLKHIPGPPTSRFTSLRHVYSILSKELLEDYATWSHKYGELVRIEPNVLLTSSPDLVMRMSGVRSKYGKDPEFYLLARLAPGKENLASLTDESLHGRHKAKLAPAYTQDVNGAREPTIDAHLSDLLDSIRTNYLATSTSTNTMDLAKEMQYFTTKAIIELTFGPAFDDLLTDEVVGSLVDMPEDAFNFPGFLYAMRLTQFMGSPIISCLMSPKENPEVGMGKFLSVTNQLNDEKFLASIPKNTLGMIQVYIQNGLDSEQVAHDALTQVLAGQVTVSAAISGIILLLMSNPRVLSTLRKEIDDAWDRSSTSEHEGKKIVTWTETLELPYLQAVIREGLRIFPPTVDPLPRITPPEGDSVEVGDRNVFIPGGTRVLTSTWAITRRTDVFGEDADIFRPERWIGLDTSTSVRMQKVADLIFGFGKGRCLGITIARIIISKAVFELVRRYDMALTKPWSPMTNVLNMGAWERSKMMVIVTEREAV